MESRKAKQAFWIASKVCPWHWQEPLAVDPEAPHAVCLRRSVSTSPPPDSKPLFFLPLLTSPKMKPRFSPAWVTWMFWPPGKKEKRKVPLKWHLGYKLKLGVPEFETSKWHLTATILAMVEIDHRLCFFFPTGLPQRTKNNSFELHKEHQLSCQTQYK